MPLYTRYKLPSYRKSYPLFCDFRTSFWILYDSIGSFIALQFVILLVSVCYQKQKNNFQYSSKKKSLRKRTLCICKLTHMRSTIKKAPNKILRPMHIISRALQRLLSCLLRRLWFVKVKGEMRNPDDTWQLDETVVNDSKTREFRRQFDPFPPFPVNVEWSFFLF